MRSPLLFCLALAGLPLLGQFTEISQGPGYHQQVFVDLDTRTTTAIDLTDWEIAFGVEGFSSAIFINEGVVSSQAGSPPQVELYASSATDFATADTTAITERIYNDEASWAAGALNHVATPGDPFDLGWGRYSPATQTVTGSRVFFLRGRDRVWRKLFIESLAGGVYTFRYAKADGSEEQAVTIDKADFPGKTLAYFSFSEGVRDLEPATWDLTFTRYTTPLPDGEGNLLDYTLTGVLHNAGVRVAELSGVDPATVAVPEDLAAYSDTLDVIGHDWKAFDLNTFTWRIPTDLVYFVRRADGQTFRLQFIDFEGASTGLSVALLGDEGTVTDVADLPAGIEAATLYPNPVRTTTFVELRTHEAYDRATLAVFSATGQATGIRAVVRIAAGANRIPLDLSGLPRGHYFVRLQLGAEGVLVRPVVVQ
jgi:hypothetical protein